MFIDSSKAILGGKTYSRHLLRDSYRDKASGKVRHHTIANLSHYPEEEIEAIKLALKHKDNLASLGSIKDLKTRLGMRIGVVYTLKTVAERVGLTKALGPTREGKLALWQVMARLIGQGSRLRAVRLAESHAGSDVLGLEDFNEDDLYANLSWLSERQEAIEQRLFRQRYGYNRDGKKGKMQLVIGLLEGPDGTPLAVRVFEGNTKDTKTVAEQIQILANGFGVSGVTLVGDRGMIKYPEIKQLNAHFFHYITAITKPQIRTLLRQGIFQMDLFENKLCEIETEGTRYILRRNPERAREIAVSREDKLAIIRNLLEQKNRYLMEHPRAKAQVAQKEVETRINKLQIADWVKVNHNNRLAIVIDENVRQEIAVLDGCYVIKTDVPAAIAGAETIHERYRDLAMVEDSFRNFKGGC